MNNIFVSKQATQLLLAYVDEEFENASKLYYFLDYTVAMELIEEQTAQYTFADGKVIILVPMELHRNGEMLYAVVVHNDHDSKQTRRVIDFETIGEAFMTSKQLYAKFGIFAKSLPVGARQKNNYWTREADKIEITAELIRNTDFVQVKSVQTKGKGHKSRRGGKRGNTGRGKNSTLDLSAVRFQELALAALAEFEDEFVTIAQVRFREYQYHLERLLPVWIPEVEQFVALAFRYNGSATQVSAIYMDLTDMKNKANLVEMVPAHSWLNQQSVASIQCLRLHSHAASPSVRRPTLSWSNQAPRPSLQQVRSAPIPSVDDEKMPMAHPMLMDSCSWNSNDSELMSTSSQSRSPSPTSPLVSLAIARPTLRKHSLSEPTPSPTQTTPLVSLAQLDVLMSNALQHQHFFEQIRRQHSTERRSQSVTPPPVLSMPVMMSFHPNQAYVYPSM